MYQIGNVYFIAAVAVVGGALFGFDISSMSAIISTNSYRCYFNQGPQYLETHGTCSGPRSSVQGIYFFSTDPLAFIEDIPTYSASTSRWHNCSYARGLLAWCADLWLYLGYSWKKESHTNWGNYLVSSKFSNHNLSVRLFPLPVCVRILIEIN